MGAALMHAVLGAADALDFAVVVLVGHTDYYPKFGFVAAGDLGITSPEPWRCSHGLVQAIAISAP